jgi:ureidoacrylate peracid hydrolase
MQEKTWLARHPLGTSSMHQANILDAVRERAGRRRGGIAVFDHPRPRQTAHIVIDLQNGFMGHGQVAEVPMARAIVPNVNRISAALREAGGVVVYLQHTIDEEAIRTWPVYFEHFCGPEHRARMIETFAPDVAQQDLVVIKRRFGAFVPGSSDLHARLQQRGIDTLIISGTLSQVCCDSTARDAMMMNYVPAIT